MHTTTNQLNAEVMGEGLERTYDRRGTQGGAHSIVLRPVELGGRIYKIIEAIIKLIIFLAVLRS
jgi:hypothetical protein